MNSAHDRPLKRQPLTARALLEVRHIHGPAVSPDGSRVIFVVEESDFEESRVISALWSVDIKQGSTRRLTYSYEGERLPQWSPDGKWIAFLSARPDFTQPPPDEDEEYPPREQVWILPADGGEAARLTNFCEGAIAFEWSPDSQTIIVLVRESRTPPMEMVRRACRKRREDAYAEDEDKRRLQFWEVGLEDRRADLLYTGDYGIAEFKISPDGQRLLFNSNTSGDPNDYHRFDLYVLDLQHGIVTRPCERQGGKFDPQWSPDGTAVTFIAHTDPQLSFSQTRIYRVHADGSDAESVWSDALGDAVHHRWSQQEIVASAIRGTEVRLVRLPSNDAQGQVLPSGPEVVADFALGPAGMVAAVGEGSTGFQELHLLQSDGSWLQLTDLNQRYREQFALPMQRTIRWTSDGEEIEGVLTLPTGQGVREPYPLLVQVHGGPHAAAANCLDGYYMPTLYATEGFLVLQPNYRGSAGYGNGFATAARGDLGGRDYRDIMAGIDHLVAEGLADPARLAIMGGSYGGYLTNWAISQSSRFRAAISMFGMFNLVTSTANSEISRFELEYIGNYYWEDPEAYRLRSPSTYLKQISTPTLILHGDLDNNTFISNSKEMHQALKERGVPVEFVHFPREGHGLREPNHRLEESRRCLAWLDRYVRNCDAAAPRFRIGDRIEHEDFELRVLHLEDAHYLGWDDARGRLMELAFALSSADSVQTGWEFRMEDVHIVTAEGEVIRPAGVVGDIGGGRTLVEGNDLRSVLAPDRDTGRLSVALALGFVMPDEPQSVLIRIADLPGIHSVIGPRPPVPQVEPEPSAESAGKPPKGGQRRLRQWQR